MIIFDSISAITTSALNSFFAYVPNLVGGIIILAIGLVIAQIARRLLSSVFGFFKIGTMIEEAKLGSSREVRIWQDTIVEIVSWAIVILFLIPAAEAWGLTRVTEVLNKLLFFIPNLLVAVIIAFVGLVLATLASDIVRHSIRTVGAKSANTLATITKGAVIFFTALIVLNQLGVAQDLVRILFTGIVAMVAIAGGLAFGLGGQVLAKEILEELKKSVK